MSAKDKPPLNPDEALDTAYKSKVFRKQTSYLKKTKQGSQAWMNTGKEWKIHRCEPKHHSMKTHAEKVIVVSANLTNYPKTAKTMQIGATIASRDNGSRILYPDALRNRRPNSSEEVACPRNRRAHNLPSAVPPVPSKPYFRTKSPPPVSPHHIPSQFDLDKTQEIHQNLSLNLSHKTTQIRSNGTHARSKSAAVANLPSISTPINARAHLTAQSGGSDTTADKP